MNVELHIEALVRHGFSPGDPKPTKIIVHVRRRARWDIVLT